MRLAPALTVLRALGYARAAAAPAAASAVEEEKREDAPGFSSLWQLYLGTSEGHEVVVGAAVRPWGLDTGRLLLDRSRARRASACWSCSGRPRCPRECCWGNLGL